MALFDRLPTAVHHEASDTDSSAAAVANDIITDGRTVASLSIRQLAIERSNLPLSQKESPQMSSLSRFGVCDLCVHCIPQVK